jgi:DNA ligase D-like protein (predicted ligase)/DNA ligase D-like protein (predicted 3'-phosphoesterase)
MIKRYKPMLAKDAKAPFTDKDWIFEVKWDGFRAIAYVNREISLRSRNQKELINNFPELKELQQQTQKVVLDGEIIILREGQVNFQALLERKTASQTEIMFQSANSPAAYIVFDILEKDGKPLLKVPLIERKKILKKSVIEGKHILLADFVEEKGAAYFEAVLQKGLEGIMAKKKNSTYESGVRSSSWQKIKKLRTCDCVIFGYTKGTGARASTFGALVLGLFDRNGNPSYVGKVGTGFSNNKLTELISNFQTLKTDVAPFEVDFSNLVIWLKPKLVCEVIYQVVTDDGKLRMPRFQRLRRDKKPEECTTEQLGTAPLGAYVSKRNFARTTEPRPNVSKEVQDQGLIFVVQEHHSRRLHYDFRLERDGVLKSWAVPKGVPEDTDAKRLAVETEDHPIGYAQFEGDIPAGEYGAGKVIIWDKGTYETKVWDAKMVEIVLKGNKLNGRYVLVPLKRAGEKNWLMLKAKD